MLFRSSPDRYLCIPACVPALVCSGGVSCVHAAAVHIAYASTRCIRRIRRTKPLRLAVHRIGSPLVPFTSFDQ